MLDQQITRLNKSVLFHQDKLSENADALSAKQQERAQFDTVRTPVQSDNEGEEGDGGEEEVVPDALMEQNSGGSGAVGDSARPVAGTAKKRRCLGSAHVLNELVEREISQLSKEEALRFQALFAQQLEKANVMDEGTLSILRLEQEANERDAVLLGTRG